MRIHTSAPEATVRLAADRAGVRFDRLTAHGSRKRDHAFDVTLFGASRRRPNNGGRGDGYAATWDQWGVFLSVIFADDPDAMCRAYNDAADFHWKTGDRFTDGWPTDTHGDHKWEVGVPFQQECHKCSAVRRWRISDEQSAAPDMAYVGSSMDAARWTPDLDD